VAIEPDSCWPLRPTLSESSNTAATMISNALRTENARTASECGVLPHDLASIWVALVEDSSAAVKIVTVAGHILFANEVANSVYAGGIADKPLSGNHLRDYFSEAIVGERLSLAQEVVRTGVPQAIEGMLKGKLVRSVFRPLPARPAIGSCVLIVTRVCTEQSTNRIGNAKIALRKAQFHDHGELGKLTARELEILKLIGIGLSTAEIAEKLGRSVKTVEWHRVSLGEKLGIANRVELARIAIAAGIVWLDTDTLPSAAQTAAATA
jgi:DNA-binding CsgD family transcriptional regulator